jgi:hypothetical protein
MMDEREYSRQPTKTSDDGERSGEEPKPEILVEENTNKRKKSTIEWRDIVDNNALTLQDKYPLLHSKKLHVPDLEDDQIQQLCTNLYEECVNRSGILNILHERCALYEKRMSDLRASQHSNKRALCLLAKAVDPMLESCELSLRGLGDMHSRFKAYSREIKSYIAHLDSGSEPEIDQAFGPGSVVAGQQMGSLSALALAAETYDYADLTLRMKALRTRAKRGKNSQFIMHIVKVESKSDIVDRQEHLIVPGLYVLQMELRLRIESIINKKLSDMSNMVKKSRYRLTLMKNIVLLTLEKKPGSVIPRYLSEKLPDNASQGIRFIHISDVENTIRKIIESKGIGARQQESLMSLCSCLQQHSVQQEMDQDLLDIEGECPGPSTSNDDDVIHIDDDFDFLSYLSGG